MKIELKEITIRDLVKGYVSNDEEGVRGYNGKLNIRPKYQREFVYDEKKRNAVIDSITKDFPLNTMYWVVNGDGTFEVLDGQQRTISICEYVAGNFSVENIGFANLQDDQKTQILNYELMVYFCEGDDSEKLNWFKTVNIAGERLTAQELRNAVYSGEWLTHAKKRFSKTGCPAQENYSKFLSGSAIRQEYLETALKWINEGNIEDYMSKHQHADNAEELWDYFVKVMTWVQTTFTKYRKEMKGVEWGLLYNRHKDVPQDADAMEKRVDELMQDEDVTRKQGIYYFVFNGEEKELNIRSFRLNDKRTAFEKQGGKCASCGEKFAIERMEADHIDPWSKGGKTEPSNCQVLCKKCNSRKSNKHVEDTPSEGGLRIRIIKNFKRRV